MPVSLQNTTITGVAVGGLPANCVNTASIANNNVTAIKLAFAQQSAAANGYIRMPNGYIIQWLQTNFTTAETDVSFTFPITFPNTCFRVVSGTHAANGNSDGMAQLRSFTTSGGVVRMNKFNSAGGELRANIVAIGR